MYPLILSLCALAAATPSPLSPVNIPLNAPRSLNYADNILDELAFEDALNAHPVKYDVDSPASEAKLHRRASTTATVPLADLTVQNYDRSYVANITIGSINDQKPPQVFQAVMDTGSSALVVPGPKCTDCSGRMRYDEGGVYEGNTTHGSYRIAEQTSGFTGDNYLDDVTIASLTVQNVSLISLTQSLKQPYGNAILGLGFSSARIQKTNQATFFEQLIAQGKVSAPEFAFRLGRARENTTSVVTLGGHDPHAHTIPLTALPVTSSSHWSLNLTDILIANTSLTTSSCTNPRLKPPPLPRPHIPGPALISTSIDLISVPRAVAAAIYARVPGAVRAHSVHGGDMVAYWNNPCKERVEVSLVFGGEAFAIDPLDFSLGVVGGTGAETRLNANANANANAHNTGHSGRTSGAPRIPRPAVRRATTPSDAAGTDLSANGAAAPTAQKGQMCRGAIVGIDTKETSYVVGTIFLKNWYTVFNYGENGGNATISFGAMRGDA